MRPELNSMHHAHSSPPGLPQLSLTLDASAAGVAQAQQAVEQVLTACGSAMGTRARALLLIEEAIMNVAMHGHASGTGPHQVQLALRLFAESIELSLSDDGRPFDPCHAVMPARPTHLAQAQPGGLGVQLMRRFARDMHYERRDGINLLRLWLDR